LKHKVIKKKPKHLADKHKNLKSSPEVQKGSSVGSLQWVLSLEWNTVQLWSMKVIQI